MTSLSLPPSADKKIAPLEGAENVMVGWIDGGDTSGQFAVSLANTLLQDPHQRIQAVMRVRSSPRIVQARTEVADGFLQSQQDWLLMIDADMAWDYTGFDKLCRAADLMTRPILGGLCFGGGLTIGPNGQPVSFPTLYRMTRDDEGGIHSEAWKDYPKNRVVQVDATGAAFLLVHKQVFIAMHNKAAPLAEGQPNPHPWFAETYVSGRPIGEDVTFCLRAKALGIPTHVHTGVGIAHEKRYFLTEETYNRSRR